MLFILHTDHWAPLPTSSFSLPPTNTHTYAHTHACMHGHTHTHACTHAHTHTHTRTHLQSHLWRATPIDHTLSLTPPTKPDSAMAHNAVWMRTRCPIILSVLTNRTGLSKTCTVLHCHGNQVGVASIGWGMQMRALLVTVRFDWLASGNVKCVSVCLSQR